MLQVGWQGRDKEIQSAMQSLLHQLPEKDFEHHSLFDAQILKTRSEMEKGYKIVLQLQVTKYG